MTYSNLSSIQADLSLGKITLPELVNSYLSKIEENKHLNAFLEVFAEEAKANSISISEKLKEGRAGRLAGMVLALKDNICYKGHSVSASSKILEGFTSIYSSTVVERLLLEDAIIIGRLNCDEFAMGASNENSAFGPVLNYADPTRVSGGSSGGAAVSVQAGMCLASLGSDTGGSIRQPAAFCGLYGFKPTYGKISRWGLIAYASSFDIIGPITNCVEDMQLLMEIIAGADEHDATASVKPLDSFVEDTSGNKKYKFAYIKETMEMEGIEPGVKASTEAYLTKLRDLGHEVEAVSFDLLPYMIPVYYTLTTAEASSNLSRFAGMHYGYRSKDAFDLESTIRKSRSEGFGPEVKRRIMLGTFVLSAGYYDAYYSKAQKVRRLVQDKTKALFETYDFIVSPTSPTTAFKIGEKSDNPIAMYLADIFTVHANIAGVPALSIPNGKDENGMPIGLQIMANMHEDAKLLSLAKALA
ncbi:MAG: Asp-tRNA(Asn)/Glu-tRNA(Gln) amidotransferase GatCAB subunit A [Bacteroidetes bacterium B1(2017)]|nr:MAG: Asp-tRNA(Asn)/Glu-tRNA(Gln) amidotransferase GatCAB subunit A [Bacteroidetes bacterium B1(2017)]